MGPVSTRICVPNLVAVRRSCRKRGGGVQTDRQTKKTAALYSKWRSAWGHGVGTPNEEGIKVLDFATVYKVRILNTSYQKRKNHLVIYSSGGRETQIEYIMLRKEHASECRHCKVLPSEAITTQHRILIADLVENKTKESSRKETVKMVEAKR